MQGADGNLYGTTELGGPNRLGTAYRITAQGNFTTLHSFSGAEGYIPYAGLELGINGDLYGTTPSGGANGVGTVFAITTGGMLTDLHSFDGSDGQTSYSGLVLVADGNFYGTTSGGGTNHAGTVFKITPAGQLTTLYNFCAQLGCADGSQPLAGLVQGSDGNFYGTNGLGTVYTITAQGRLTTLHRFNGTDGEFPEGTLVQGTDGNFFRTSAIGGTGGHCMPDCGTVFSITATGNLTTLHNFDFGTNGDTPDAGLVQETDGTFYGTTRYGGTGGGSIYSLSTGLRPFVAFVNRFGKVGSKAEILGQGFKSAKPVSFNGTAAMFVVISDTELTATVPTGATTGFVTVITSAGKLKSNQEFVVLP